MPTRSPDGEALAAGDDGADHLVSEDERELRLCQLAVDDVEIGAADAAGGHREQHLSGTRLGVGEVGLAERRAGPVEDHGSHRQR